MFLDKCTFYFVPILLSRIFKRYRELNAELIPKDMTQGAAHVVRVQRSSVEKMPEFKVGVMVYFIFPTLSI